MSLTFNPFSQAQPADDQQSAHGGSAAAAVLKAEAPDAPNRAKQQPSLVNLADALQHCAKALATLSVPQRFSDTLPLVQGQLEFSRLDEAAGKLGLSVQVKEVALLQASPLAPPFIAFTTKGDAFVVLELVPNDNRVRTVAFVDGEAVERQENLQALSQGSLHMVVYLARHEEPRAKGSLFQERGQHWFWSAASRFRASYAQVIVACFLVNVLALAAPLFIMNVYDRVIPNLTIPTLWALAAGVALAIIFDFLLKIVRAQVVDETGRRIDMSVTGRLFDHLLEVRSDARPKSTGALASHIRDFDNVRDVLTSSAVIALTDAAFIFIFLAALYWIVGPLVIVPAGAAILVLLVTVFTQVPMSRAMQRAQSDSSKRHGILVETLLSLDSVKALGGGATLRKRFDHAVAESSRSSAVARFWSTLNTTVLQTVGQAVSILIIIWGVFLVLDAQISVGALIAANILSGRVLAPLASVASTLQRVQNARFSFKAIDQVMNLPTEWTNAEATRPLQRPALRLEGLSFSYNPQSPPALEGISFSLEPGDRLGIIGRIGSGKSTLGRLLCGLSQPSSGRILIDEVDLQQVPPSLLRSMVGYVPQDPELISGTLRDNLTLGAPFAKPTDIDRAIDMAGLNDLARTHPMGLSMPIEERGRSLSGGQRHSIAIGRALIRRPKLLFLDEPTAALDMAAERHLLNGLEALSKDEGVTLILATHRNTTLKAVSQLMVLEKGKVAAFGPRDNVLAALEEQALSSPQRGAA